MDVVKLVRRNPIVFPLACAAAVAMLFISEGSYWQSVAALDELGAIQAARVSTLVLAQSILDAEAGQRAYLASGRKEFLQPYAEARRSIDESFRALDLYYGGAKSDQKDTLARLRALTDAKLSELAQAISAYDASQAGAARALAPGGAGPEPAEPIGALGTALLGHESLDLVAARRDLDRMLMLARISMAALCAIGLLALYLYLRHTAAFEKHQHEIKETVRAERDRLEIEVRNRTAQLTELTHHLQTAREDERNRLARNLHDELGALLTSAKLDAARIKSRLGGAAPEALERLAHLVDALNASIALGRRIVEDLRPSALVNLGLVATLEILAREFAERAGVQVHCELAPVRLGPAAELVVYRAVQEAITNITKYAKASQVWIALGARGDQAEVTVRDDGVGFDTAAHTSSAYGLVGMRYRVEAEGGRLSVESAPGRGTLVRVTLPQA